MGMCFSLRFTGTESRISNPSSNLPRDCLCPVCTNIRKDMKPLPCDLCSIARYPDTIFHH